MADLNTLACAGSSLYLIFANDIKSHGDIAGFAAEPSKHIHYGFLATPTHQQCGAGESAAQRLDLPENMREPMLRQRPGRIYYQKGAVTMKQLFLYAYLIG